ncbi:MAG: beta-ketoacyl synthase N-terminal-like domain-containing protein [Phycisphaeraceae bacterium]
MSERLTANTAAREPAPRLVIAGLGLLTPLGHAAWPTFAALLAGRTIADRAARLTDDVDPVNLVRALGGVSIVQHSRADPAVELAERAAREALFAAGVDATGLPTYLGTSKGAVQALTRCAAGSGAEAHAHLEAVALGPHGYITRHLQQRLGITPRGHYVAACASSLTALDRARRALLHPHAGAQRSEAADDHALVITAEAALLPQFVHSYRRLGVLAPLTPRDYRQRPLDARRTGFMLTEAGAAVLLRRLPPGQSPQPGEIELLDTATAAEAHDLVRAAPDMSALRHIAAQLFAHHPLDMIHPHAPGTPDHDPVELAIYHDLLHNARPERSEGRDHTLAPDLYANKGALGHSLGAAGLVSLILACLTLQAGQRPPMLWIDAPLPGVRPEAQPCNRTGTHAVFAAGFAGHVAGALIRRH